MPRPWILYSVFGVGRELFRFDGTSIELVEDLLPGLTGSDITRIGVFQGELYLGTDAEGAKGIELYKLDVVLTAVVPEPSTFALTDVGVVELAQQIRN